ncbi:MAG TPA: phytoene desaturase family protein [Ktedonobacteraceae bacterium]|nr:phytoene desaturase family protein [Ktedonobacteraceae bacterium]
MYVHSHPTALVIGAGLGGIATAARLARAGFSVKVLEKQDAPGGRCSQLIRDGHRFDTGATLFLMPGVFAETYTALGEDMEDHLELHRIDPTYRIRFEDSTELALTSNLNAMETQLEAIEPGSFGGLLRYLVEGYESYHLCLQRFVGRNFYHFTEYFSLQNLPLLIKLKALVKHYDNIGHYFHDSHLKAAFTFQNMYLGLSPFDAPATYSLVQYTELAEGVWYPRGGIYRVIESLASVAEDLGVNFMYNTPVQQIEVDGNRATGVVLQDGSRLSADVIVANADLPYVYSHLLPDSAEAHRLERLKYTCSAIMFYWGVDRLYPQLGTHNVFLADDYRTSFDRIFHDHLLPDEPSFYVHAPARTDSSAAPIGQDTLMVLVPAGHLDAGTAQDWDTLLARARSAVIHRLAASTGIVDLEQHLKCEVSYTPRDWLSLFNLAKGAAFGLSHNFMQVGFLRPHNRHQQYSNLYFVGSSTHPGTGLPMVLLSARLTTERILKENSIPNHVPSLKPAVAV